ncbi:MAG: hypothetical protein LBU85_01850 [Treponema sp.]|jgi:hypothetical protein|nr:hypothetical protein [Treponema sp.]
MIKKSFVLVIIFLAAPALFPEELPNVFPLFLSKLVERHEELKNTAMPDVEILTASGFEGEAVYMVNFKTPEDGRLFYAALKKEELPCLAFPNDDKKIGLFHSDLLVFLMKAAIGL